MRKNLTLADLLRMVQGLERQIALITQENEWHRAALRVYGIEGVWVSPEQAGKLLGSSRDRVKTDIDLAEDMRLQGKTGDMVYGTHYRNDQSPTASQPTWKINIVEYAKLLKIPPDQRRLG